MPNFGWNRFKFVRASVLSERSGTAQQILQPLQGSGEQVAPPTTSSSQASLMSGTTAGGDNVSQSSSQENATGSSVSHDLAVNLEVFSCIFLILYSGCSLLVCCFFCCSTLQFLVYVFSITREPVFSFCAWSTWSVIYSVGFAMLCFSRLSLERHFGLGPLCSDSGAWFALSGLIVVVDGF